MRALIVLKRRSPRRRPAAKLEKPATGTGHNSAEISLRPSSGLRIGVYVRPGSETYLRRLLPVLTAQGNHHQWFLYGSAGARLSLSNMLDSVTFRLAPSFGGGIVCTLAEQVWLPVLMRRDRVDLVYTPGSVGLLAAPTPRVTEFSGSESRWLTPCLLRCSGHIVFPSDFFRNLALKQAPGRAGSFSTVCDGIAAPAATVPARPAWTPQGYLLVAAESIRGLDLKTTVEAYRRCRFKGLTYPLLVAANTTSRRQERRLRRRLWKLGFGTAVYLAANLSETEKSALMAHADALIYPDRTDVCPTILIEAMRCGAAILAAESHRNREVAGTAAKWFEAGNPGDLAADIERLCLNRRHANQLRSQALTRASGFSWERKAIRLVRLMEQVAAESRPAPAPVASFSP